MLSIPDKRQVQILFENELYVWYECYRNTASVPITVLILYFTFGVCSSAISPLNLVRQQTWI